ncbi:MAG: type II toxin-antitoxin system VapC family toxin [Cyanobacteria bacterium J06639_14]
MSKVVLDASALLALVNQEPGHTIVATMLPGALASAVNISELVAKLTDQGMPQSEVQELLVTLSLTIVPFDQDQGILAGYLRHITKQFGLSLGDRACLALGMKTQCLVVTTDKIWAKLDINVGIQVIR